MKKITTLPKDSLGTIDPVVKYVTDDFIIGTTAGLLKKENEDSIGCSFNDNTTRICIADGHWGRETSKKLVGYWLSSVNVFPNTKEKAVTEMKKVEDEIFKTFSKPNMNPQKDFTPEAAVIAIEITKNRLSVVSYGDCRLLILNDHKIKFCLKTTETWLGVFSYLNLRGRLPISNAIEFMQTDLTIGDVVVLFTDGIDQCVYEKDTISFAEIAEKVQSTAITAAFDNIMKEVFLNGAEDNASIGIIKV